MKINADFSSLDLHQLNLSTATDSPELDSKKVTEIEIFYASQNTSDIIPLNIRQTENDLISDYHSLEVDKALTQMQSTIWKNEFVGWKDEGDPMRFSSPASELLN